MRSSTFDVRSIYAVAGVLAAVAAAVGLLAMGRPAGAAPSTFTPEADAYVIESSPDTNFGSIAILRVDSSPITQSYLRFNVQGLSGTVSSATLRIFANSSQTTGFDVHDVADDSWVESGITGITYNNAPDITPAIVASSGPVTAMT